MCLFIIYLKKKLIGYVTQPDQTRAVLNFHLGLGTIFPFNSIIITSIYDIDFIVYIFIRVCFKNKCFDHRVQNVIFYYLFIFLNSHFSLFSNKIFFLNKMCNLKSRTDQNVMYVSTNALYKCMYIRLKTNKIAFWVRVNMIII